MIDEHAQEERVSLDSDGESGRIESLSFRSRILHRLLSDSDTDSRGAVARDALAIGAEVLSRAAEHGDLHNLEQAVARLDQEAKRIVEDTAEKVERTVEKTIKDFGETIQGGDGPLAALVSKFDVATQGNVIDTFRDLVANTTQKATSQAVAQLSESSNESMTRLGKSIAALERVAAAEEARLAEMSKGTSKGLVHEKEVEFLLGELVAVGGDSLDDVSTVPGLLGTKKGDKTITPRRGCMIVTEEKCTSRITESRARALLDEAKANRGADLAMMIVESEEKVPGSQPYYLIDDDKVIVVADRLALRLVYSLFRARAIEVNRAKSQVTIEQASEVLNRLRSLVEEIGGAVSRFRLLRIEHGKARKAIDQASTYTDEIADCIGDDVDRIMTQIDRLVDRAAEAA
jgi:hypothetical protein